MMKRTERNPKLSQKRTQPAPQKKKKVYLNFNKAQTAWAKLVGRGEWGVRSRAPSYGGSLSCYVHRTAAAFAFISVACNIWNGALLISVMNYWCAQRRLHSWLIQGISPSLANLCFATGNFDSLFALAQQTCGGSCNWYLHFATATAEDA